MAKHSRARSALIGLSWGAGHASTIVALGAPVVLWTAELPSTARCAVEAIIGVIIFALGLRLLLRRGRGDAHTRAHRRPHGLREAYAVGVLHGAGGSAGMGLLII